MINMQKMNKKQAGFTLIELVMVIVILGILSAFALPRFADLTGNARTASIEGLRGALKSAAAISHAQQIASGLALGGGITLEGQAVTMVNGYPTANAAGISAAVNLDTNDYSATAGGTAGAATITFTINGYTPAAGTTCQVVYTAANAATDNTPPLTASYIVSSLPADTAGC